MQVETIKLFCDVAAQQSISEGAAAHGITQPAASQRIMALERELGVRLIDRSKRPLRLTAPGQRFHQGCLRLLEQYEALKRQIADTAAGGDVVIAAIYSAGIDLLNQVRTAFEREHPGVRVTIHYVQPDEVYRRLIEQRCDFGILSYPERWRDLASVDLRREAMVLVCRPAHRLADRAEVAPSELANEPLAGFDAKLPISVHLAAYLRRHGVKLDPVSTFDNIDTIKACVADTGAVAVLPARTVGREVDQGILAAVPLRPELVRPVSVVYPRHRAPSPLARLFIDEYLLNHPPASREAAAGVKTAALG